MRTLVRAELHRTIVVMDETLPRNSGVGIGSVPLQPARSRRRLARRALLGLMLAYALLQLVPIALHAERHQWDFQTYYFAAKSHAAGLDPYDSASLTRVAGHPVRLPFVYPPYTLYVFRPFAVLPLAWALRAFLLLKVAALVGLFALWQRTLRCSVRDPWFAGFCIAALSSTIYCDVVAGNVSIFEQLFLWAAFDAYIRRRLGAFCGFVVAASVFKLTPLAFLALVPFARTRRRVDWLAGSATVVTAAICGTYVGSPHRFEEWVKLFAFAGGRHATPDINPSLLALFSRTFERADGVVHLGVASAASMVVFIFVVMAVLGVTARTIAGARWMHGPYRERELVVVACLVDALLSPRLVTYSFVLVLAPLYVLARRMNGTQARPLVLAAAVIAFASSASTTPLGLSAVMNVVTSYYPLMIVAAAWAVYSYTSLTSRSRLNGSRAWFGLGALRESIPAVLAYRNREIASQPTEASR